MSVLLEQDRNRALQSHLDELTWRTTLVFAAVVTLTLVWSYFVDDVLDELLTMLKPCAGDCLNVYDPAQWSAVRWLTALLLGVFSALPLMLFHINQFTKPGLLPTEHKALQRWLIATSVLLVGTTALFLTKGLPQLYKFGFEQHQQAGLAAQYSAIDMLLVAAFCIWAFMVIIATWTCLLIMGTLNVVHRETADYWRLRIYGIGSLLLILSLPDHAAPMLLPLLATYWTTTELLGQRWFNATLSVNGTATVRLDAEGRRRRISVVDCACAGANSHHGHAKVPGCYNVSVDALCTPPTSRTTLLEHVIQTRVTDVVITGCDTKACPTSLISNMHHLDVAVHGMNLMDLQNHRVTTPHPELDVLYSFHSIPALFSQQYQEQTLLEMVNSNTLVKRDLRYRNLEDARPWNRYVREDDVLIPRCSTFSP